MKVYRPTAPELPAEAKEYAWWFPATGFLPMDAFPPPNAHQGDTFFFLEAGIWGDNSIQAGWDNISNTWSVPPCSYGWSPATKAGSRPETLPGN
jgi:hypothetical protein